MPSRVVGSVKPTCAKALVSASLSVLNFAPESFKFKTDSDAPTSAFARCRQRQANLREGAGERVAVGLELERFRCEVLREVLHRGDEVLHAAEQVHQAVADLREFFRVGFVQRQAEVLHRLLEHLHFGGHAHQRFAKSLADLLEFPDEWHDGTGEAIEDAAENRFERLLLVLGGQPFQADLRLGNLERVDLCLNVCQRDAERLRRGLDRIHQ